MKQNSSQKRKTKGFTLVELIVVIAILAILSAVGAVAYTGYIEYTQKGADRATIGEITHALELADYANPNLFQEGSTELIWVTDKGISTSNPDVLSALNDAFGSPEGARLVYDWSKKDGGLNAARLQEISSKIAIDSNSAIQKYWAALGENKPQASFAGNIADLFAEVKSLVDGRNDYAVAQGNDPDEYLLQKAVDVSIKADPDKVVEIWKTSNSFLNDGTLNNGSNATQLLAIEVARNYAFISYAEKQDAYKNSEIMQKELKQFKAADAKVGNMYCSSSSDRKLKDSDWANIIRSYQTTQAEVDALAYLGLMEAAGAVRDNLVNSGENPNTDLFYGSLTGYVSMTESVMKSKENWESALANLRESSYGATANVTKKNGSLEIKWDNIFSEFDKEAAGESDGVEVCYREHVTSTTITMSMGSTGLTLAPSASTIDVCTKSGPEFAYIYFTFDGESATQQQVYDVLGNALKTISIPSDCIDIQVGNDRTPNYLVIDAIKPSETPITLNLTIAGSSVSITINVH